MSVCLGTKHDFKTSTYKLAKNLCESIFRKAFTTVVFSTEKVEAGFSYKVAKTDCMLIEDEESVQQTLLDSVVSGFCLLLVYECFGCC